MSEEQADVEDHPSVKLEMDLTSVDECVQALLRAWKKVIKSKTVWTVAIKIKLP